MYDIHTRGKSLRAENGSKVIVDAVDADGANRRGSS